VSPVPRCERANAFAGIQPRTGRLEGTLECGGLYRRIYQAVAGLPARKIDCVAVYDKQITSSEGTA
jgi:hypothetical protein